MDDENFLLYDFFFSFVSESLAIITKVTIKKVKLSILAITFSIFSLIKSLLYSLLIFKYYFV
jgi:hypothetical protein